MDNGAGGRTRDDNGAAAAAAAAACGCACGCARDRVAGRNTTLGRDVATVAARGAAFPVAEPDIVDALPAGRNTTLGGMTTLRRNVGWYAIDIFWSFS